MNWLLVGVLFTLAFCTIKGYQKGFIRVAFSLVSFFLVIAFVTWAEPYISDYLENNTGIYTAIQEKCEEQLKKSVENGANAEEKEQATQDVENAGESTGADPSAEEGNEPKSSLEMAGIVLPKAWEQQLIDHGIGVADQFLENSGVYTQIAEILAHYIISGIAFFLAYVIAVVLLKVISRLLNLVSRLPVIHGVNKMLGVAAGFIQGMLYVWLFFYLIAICCTSSFGIQMNRYIDQSSLLTWLYNNNPLLGLLMWFL